MALSKATMKSTIKAKMDSYMGAAEDDTKREDFAEALADAMLQILTAQAQVTGNTVVASGSSAGTWPTTGTVS